MLAVEELHERLHDLVLGGRLQADAVGQDVAHVRVAYQDPPQRADARVVGEEPRAVRPRPVVPESKPDAAGRPGGRGGIAQRALLPTRACASA